MYFSSQLYDYLLHYQVYLLFSVALFIPFFIFVLYLWLKCRRHHLPNRPKRGSLIPIFRKERQLMFIDLIRKYGSTCELEDTLVTVDPVLAGVLLTQKIHYEYRSRWYVNFSRFVLPGLHGILNMEGEEWKRHTEILGPLFATNNVARYGDIMANIAARHTGAWLRGQTAGMHGKSLLPEEVITAGNATNGEQTPHYSSPGGGITNIPSTYTYAGSSLLEAVRGMGTEVFLQWALHLDPCTTDTNEQFLITKLVDDLTYYGTLVAKMAQKPIMLLSILYQLYASTKSLQKHIYLLANRARIRMDERKLAILQGKNESLPPEDAIMRMVAAGFTLPETAAEVNHMHGAHKAATFVLTHIFHDLCQPGPKTISSSSTGLCDVGGVWWRERLREEWLTNLPHNRAPCRSDLSRSGCLPLTSAILEECERLHPVSLGIVRQTGAPLQIDDILLPSYIENVVLLWGIHMHPAIWMHPYEFHPHRWLTRIQIRTILERAESMPSENRTLNSFGSNVHETTDRHTFTINGRIIDMDQGPDMIGTAIEASLNSSNTLNKPPTVFERYPARLDMDEALKNPDKRRLVPPFAHIPFVRGGRLCAGKELARLELAVLLHGVLSRIDVQTDVMYIGHIKGIPIGIGRGHKVSRTDLPDDMVIEPNYIGPLNLLLADDMYSRIDGDIPFYVRYRQR